MFLKDAKDKKQKPVWAESFVNCANPLIIRLPVRNLLLPISCLFLLLLLSFGCSQKEDPQPPNIVLIIVDDLGSADLGCYGSTDIQTPNIDRLAANGVIFTQAYSGNTVCAPARSTLMTGQHMGHTPVRGNTGGIPLPDEAFTMAELFKQQGYATGGFGKWGLGEIGTVGVPEKQGFDRFFGYYHQIHAHNYYPEYLYENSQRVPLPAKENDPQSYTQYRIVDEMKSFIRNYKDQPFFCYAPWTVPHGQYVIPNSDPAVKLYEAKDWDEKRKNYAAMTTLFDRQVGEVVQLLEELDIQENTLVIFCSDNGGVQEFADYQTNGELRGFKRDLYEGGIRIPLIAYWPGEIGSGTKVETPVYFPDFLPTFASIIGMTSNELPENIDGVSFAPLLYNPTELLGDRILYWEYPHYDWSEGTYREDQFKQAVRYLQWKLVRVGKDNPWEVYDLIHDPGETDNVAAYHPGKRQKLTEWVEENRTAMPPQIEPERVDGKAYR